MDHSKWSGRNLPNYTPPNVGEFRFSHFSEVTWTLVGGGYFELSADFADYSNKPKCKKDTSKG